MLLTRREFGAGLLASIQILGKESFDVVVVGAGVFGAWIAYTCRLHGWSVLLLDCRGPANAMASSGGESRILRVGYGQQTFYAQWGLRSLKRWREFLAQAHAENLFVPSGLLWIGPKEAASLNSTLKSLRELGVRFEVFSSEDLRRRYPQMGLDSRSIGVLEPESGAILARRAVAAVVDAATRAGTIYRMALVLPPQVNGRLTSIRTAAGETIRAERFVFACGPWLPQVFPDVVGAKIRPTRQEVFFFAIPAGDPSYQPSNLPTWIDFTPGRAFYGMPNIEGRGLKVAADALGPQVDPETQSRVPSAEGLAAAREFLRKQFPAIGSEPCIEARVCQYENTKSGDFMIDRHPRSPNVWIVGGGSGHGFKHGPMVGEYVASLMNGGQPEARFALV